MKIGGFEKKILELDEIIDSLKRIEREHIGIKMSAMIHRLKEKRAEITSLIGKKVRG
jgi:acetyl-CoA carboxylase alpha subunit